MNHSCPKDLKPPRASADLALIAGFFATLKAGDIDFSSGLDERKIARTQPNLGFRSEHFTSPESENAFDVAHLHAAIDPEALDLMEHRGMGGIAVTAIHGARRKYAN